MTAHPKKYRKKTTLKPLKRSWLKRKPKKRKQIKASSVIATIARQSLANFVSFYVRIRDKKGAGSCLVCLFKHYAGIHNYPVNPIAVGYHIIPSTKIPTKYDERNVIGACGPCNMGEKEHRQDYERDIHKPMMGMEYFDRFWLTPVELSADFYASPDRAALGAARYEYLMGIAKSTRQFKVFEIKEMKAAFEAKLAAL